MEDAENSAGSAKDDRRTDEEKPGQLKLWVALFLLQLLAAEALLSVYFFQRRSEYPSALVHYTKFLVQRLRPKEPKRSIGIYEPHERYGYHHKPKTTGRHVTASFDVKYSLVDRGGRIMPVRESPRKKVVLLGGSFTFGHGIEDEEAYPFVLAQDFWKDWEVLNWSVSGWGTAQSYQLLRDEVLQSSPDVIFYGMIPDHVCRNYLRPAWLRMLNDSGRSHPHYELEGGVPAFQAVVGPEAAVEDGRRLRASEVDLTIAFLDQMHARSRAAGVRFVLVALPQRFDVVCGGTDWPPRLIAALAKRGIEVIDLTDQKPDVGWLEWDAHPTAAGHRVLARALAEAELVREIRASSSSADASGATTGTSTDSAGGDRAPPGNTRSVDPGVDRPRDP